MVLGKENQMSFTSESSVYDLFHEDKDYAAEARAIKKRYKKAKTILEVGAGTGLLTKELLNLGFKVTVIEPSAEMVYEMWNNLEPRHRNSKCYLSTIEEIPIGTFEKEQFDLVLAHYDVINYVKHEDQEFQTYKLTHWGKKVSIERWDPRMGVKFLTHKKVDGWHRFRIGLKIRKTAHLWFIYLGKGLVVEKHTLYL